MYRGRALSLGHVPANFLLTHSALECQCSKHLPTPQVSGMPVPSSDQQSSQSGLPHLSQLVAGSHSVSHRPQMSVSFIMARQERLIALMSLAIVDFTRGIGRSWHSMFSISTHPRGTFIMALVSLRTSSQLYSASSFSSSGVSSKSTCRSSIESAPQGIDCPVRLVRYQCEHHELCSHAWHRSLRNSRLHGARQFLSVVSVCVHVHLCRYIPV